MGDCASVSWLSADAHQRHTANDFNFGCASAAAWRSPSTGQLQLRCYEVLTAACRACKWERWVIGCMSCLEISGMTCCLQLHLTVSHRATYSGRMAAGRGVISILKGKANAPSGTTAGVEQLSVPVQQHEQAKL